MKNPTEMLQTPVRVLGWEDPPGKGLGYPLQYSWAFLVAQLVRNLPTLKEIWIQSLGWEGPLEKGMVTYFSIPTWRIMWTV